MSEKEQTKPRSDSEKNERVCQLITLREQFRDLRKKRFDRLFRRYEEYKIFLDLYSGVHFPSDKEFQGILEDDWQMSDYNSKVRRYDQELRKLDEKAWLGSWEG